MTELNPGIGIASIRRASAAEWDLYWQECGYSTFFQSREWAEIWCAYTKGNIRPAPEYIVFTDGMSAVFPLSYQKRLRGLARHYLSSPGGTFGGWLSRDSLSISHGRLLARYMLTKSGSLVWRLNPYDPLVFKTGVTGAQEDKTYALRLDEGFDAIYKSWTKGHKSAARKARKARKEGVSVKLAITLEDWIAYYQIYEDSLRRWGKAASSKYTFDLFKEMFARKSPNIKLWLSIYRGIPVAGALCFYSKWHVVYWHGAALEKYFKLRPVNLLLYEVIKDACEQGYTIFDFNPSGGHKGVEAFKKSFGASAYPSPIVIVKKERWRLLMERLLPTYKSRIPS